MNAVEIEAALSDLAAQPFDIGEFAFSFLAAFGNKETTIKRLRKGDSNASDIEGGVLQRNNIHIAICARGKVAATLQSLRDSPSTARAKAKLILATDGEWVEAEEVGGSEAIACDFARLPDHFAFFLPLAGISTIKEIKDNPIDVRATGRLNKLYVELLREDADWAKPAKRADMNHFMARLVFCFFAEDTDIFPGKGLFTTTVDRMSERDGSNTHEVLESIFRAMNIPERDRPTAKLPRWADAFPYVNGGLFGGDPSVPRFTRTARAYLYQAGQLSWREINPDIFGSMIQAVADDEERGALGMHYTSVPNILKVLNPLFLDDLRAQLDAAADNKIKLLNLRKRMARLRVFDPACGSGNFLVIAYKQMRAIEAEINRRRGEPDLKTEIPLTNFRGIELRDFPAEIARLALIIAEFQCDVLYRGQKEAVAAVLPLDSENWITCANALRLDWLTMCRPTGTGVKLKADDLFETPLDQAEIDFENQGGETFICGNPPYLGSKWQTDAQKADLKAIFDGRIKNWKSLDYVSGWFMKAADFGMKTRSTAAFVSTNSVCQGQQVSILWPEIFETGNEIAFAHTSFKWANLASHNAGVTVVIVGISCDAGSIRRLYSPASGATDGAFEKKDVPNINAYLVPGANIEVQPSSTPLQGLSVMQFGNHPYYAAPLIFSTDDARDMVRADPRVAPLIRPFYGSQEFIDAAPRACLWITDGEAEDATAIPLVAERVARVRAARLVAKKDATAQKLVDAPHRFREQMTARQRTFIVPRVSSENRPYLPVGLLEPQCVVQEKAFAMFDAPMWNLAIIASRLHWVWIGAVCVRLEMRFSYSNTLGWNTFPLPTLTEQNRADLTKCAEEILLAREAHFPATIAALYDIETMPDDLRRAHDQNDETLERIYVGRRFKNDTERLEKLFELYAKMVVAQGGKGRSK
jgi:hypothetical protein